MRRFLLSLYCAIVGSASLNAQGVLLGPRFSGISDVRALAFRPMSTGMECWLTVAAPGRDEGQQLMQAVYRDGTFSEPEMLIDAALNDPASTHNGMPAFHPCDPDQAVIVSDRPDRGATHRSSDLYMVRRKGGYWSAKRLSISSEAWDGAPCFGKRGDILYFASDRRQPGSGLADIYMSRLHVDRWTEPVLLTQISDAATHETSPFVHSDTLYFSANRTGDQDIYAIPLDAQTGYPEGSAVPLAIPGINVRGANEDRPVISPGGNWIVFSSDRAVDGLQRDRLYNCLIGRSDGAELSVRVTARTLVRDVEKMRFFGRLDSIYQAATSIRFTDRLSGITQTIPTDSDGLVTLPFSRTAAVNHPMYDVPWRTYTVEAIPPHPALVSSIDTIVIGTMGCRTTIEHQLYLQDTALVDRRCDYTFRTINAPFFVSDYWCPTTRKYRTYTPCASLFTDDLVCEHLQQPERCTINEVCIYSFEPSTVTRVRRGAEHCVDYDAFEERAEEWAAEVDRSIERMRDEVRSALLDGHVRSAVAAGNTVEITFSSTADDHVLAAECTYTGLSMDIVRSFAPHIQVDTTSIPFLATGRSFDRGGRGATIGSNQLLSDLRSMYVAILLDNLCRETIPIYRDLHQRGQLVVRSRSQSFNPPDLPTELRHAAGIDIRVLECAQPPSRHDAVPARRTVYCDETMSCADGR